jgi:hypothetical protein
MPCIVKTNEAKSFHMHSYVCKLCGDYDDRAVCNATLQEHTQLGKTERSGDFDIYSSAACKACIIAHKEERWRLHILEVTYHHSHLDELCEFGEQVLSYAYYGSARTKIEHSILMCAHVLFLVFLGGQQTCGRKSQKHNETEWHRFT